MKKLFIYVLSLSALVACKKEINLDLQNTAAQIVIEGTVTNRTPAEIIISKSVPFSNSNSFPKVSGAQVQVTDDKGVSYPLTETKPGVYTNTSLIGFAGHSYSLLVNAEGKEYTATSSMPLHVNLDSLLLEKIFMGSESIWVVKPLYNDPADFGNNYMFIETINGKRYPQYWVWDDRIVNNSISTVPLIQHDSAINAKDIIEVEMRCIDRNTLRYFTALQDSQNNATTPANPASNISGGALGYFSAHTSQLKRVQVH
jgi:hypothetical protein